MKLRTRTTFTIPFNLENGHMRGSLFWLEDWKYPLPLLRQLELIAVG